MNVKARDKLYLPIIISLSILIPVVVAVLMVIPERDAFGKFNVTALPLFHATLNGLTAITLLIGYYFIKNKKTALHRFCMFLSFALSSIFLISYVIYHYSAPPTPFGGEGIIRIIYYFILLTHILLATSIVPLALLSIYRGVTGQLQKHTRISRWTFPVWLYVAVSGVLVYIMMMPYYH